MVSEDSTHPERWSLYRCLVAEMSDNESLYILSAGQWFKVEKTFADRTLENAKLLVKDVTSLPPARTGQDEGSYNIEASGKGRVLVLLDKKLIKARRAATSIEPCDLFSSSGQFIHVKRKLHSSSLSHLFAQAAVAAETFLSDETFRTSLKKAVETRNPKVAQLLGDPKKQPNAGDYEVVFAIVTTAAPGRWPQALPFFSQLNLVRTAERLRVLGFQVSLSRIEEK